MANMFEKPIAANPISTFAALPLQFMQRAIDVKQQRYDEAQATMEEAEDTFLGTAALPGDAKAHQEILAGFEQDFDSLADSAGGDLSKVTGGINALKRKIDKELRYGKLGAINKAHKTAFTEYDAIEKRYEKGNASLGGLNRAKAALGEHVTQLQDNNTWSKYQGYTPANIVDSTQFLYDKVDEIVAKYDGEGRKLRSTGDILQVLGTSMETMPDLIKSLGESYTMGARTIKGKNGKPEKESFASFRDRTLKTIVEAKSYQEVLKQTEGGQGNAYAAGTISKDWQLPARADGSNDYKGGSSSIAKAIGEWAGFDTTKEHSTFVASAEGKRLINHLNKTADTQFPAKGSYLEQNEWIEDNVSNPRTVSIVAGKATPNQLKRGIDAQGFLNSRNAIYPKGGGDPLTGDQAQAIQGINKETGQKAKIVGIVGEGGGGGYYPMGSYMILGADGNEYIQETSDPDILNSSAFNMEQINTVLTATTGKSNVTLQGDIRGADGSIGIPRGQYTITHNNSRNDQNVTLSQNGVPMYIKLWEKKDGKNRLVIKKVKS